jgi:hypothetical protein
MHTPMPSREEVKESIGSKIAAWGIVLMIFYLVFIDK